MSEEAWEPSEAPGKAFEQRVVDAYRTLGYQVTSNVQLPGKQTDLVARQDIRGAPPISLAIECKDHAKPIGNEVVHGFVSRVVSQVASSTVTGGVLVSSSGFTADARAAGAGHKNVTLISWEELTSQILDVRHQVRELVEHYETLEIFHDYLPLAVELLGWASLTPEASRPPDLSGLLREWFEFDGETGIGALLVLADFGAGKTTLLRNLEYDRAKAYVKGEDARVPLFVPLRDFRESQDIGTLLRASFRDAYYRDLPTDLLWQRIESGRFYVLFDGFDEMVDRSDANRRLELFHALMPVLRSRSPAILTSRPSYLVERGELDGLLSELKAREAAIGTPISAGGSHRLALANRLRQKLVERHRELHPAPGANDILNVREVQVIRLLPLDEDRVEEFVGRHAAELEAVGASVAALLAFIERTYDLTDLASRPMLLNLIISSVLIGGLDLSDTNAQYGASGLYEIYTHAKLDLDLAKGRVRRNGLTLETRRLLAEALAIRMYRSSLLEVDFQETLEGLRSEPGALREALKGSGLSEQEIATDFATCSFVTLDRDGKCRFVHKSFRGFFIARKLKQQLSATHSMLTEPLEREVLYFLGGFAPTEPAIGEALWSKFLRTEKEDVALRRNLLVAFLYTQPDHDTRKIVDAEIFEAEFGRLGFNGTRFTNVTWRDSTVMELGLVGGKWRDVRLVDSHFAALTTEGGEVDLKLWDSVFESWHSSGTRSQLALEGSTLHSWELTDASVRLTADGSHVRQLRLDGSEMVCDLEEENYFSIGKAKVLNSRLRMSGDWGPASLRGDGSAIVYGGRQEALEDWAVERCLVTLSRAPGARQHTDEVAFRADAGSVILAPRGIVHPLLGAAAGVFGSVQAASGAKPIRWLPAAWGVLEAEDILDALILPAKAPGCRLGDLLLVGKEWYEERLSGAVGGLSAVAELERLAEAAPDSGYLAPDGRLAFFLRSARAEYELLLTEDWPSYLDCGAELEKTPEELAEERAAKTSRSSRRSRRKA